MPNQKANVPDELTVRTLWGALAAAVILGAGFVWWSLDQADESRRLGLAYQL